MKSESCAVPSAAPTSSLFQTEAYQRTGIAGWRRKEETIRTRTSSSTSTIWERLRGRRNEPTKSTRAIAFALQSSSSFGLAAKGEIDGRGNYKLAPICFQPRAEWREDKSSLKCFIARGFSVWTFRDLENMVAERI
jgi:hypothetical protein